MLCLITGDQGFVGTETKKTFKEKRIEVVGYDILSGKDIRDMAQLEREIRLHRPDRILHLAAIARFDEADEDIKLASETNIVGTCNVAVVASKYQIPVIYTSTGSVYMPIKRSPPIREDFEARGNSVYGCTKAIGEKYIQVQEMPWIIFRYAHLYGKEKRMHGLIGGFIDRINRGLSPVLYGGRQSNDFTYIKDVAWANYLAVTAPLDRWKQIYNIGSGEELTAEDAGRMVCEIVGYAGGIETQERRTVDPERFVYDCSKAEKMLGFKAKFKFEDGLRDMFKS